MVGEGKVAKAFALTEALGEAVQHRACVLRPWGQVLHHTGSVTSYSCYLGHILSFCATLFLAVRWRERIITCCIESICTLKASRCVTRQVLKNC